MSLVKCSVCGFIFNEEKGLADQGIKPNTKWEDVPEIFACPLCGAAKSLFEAVVEETGSLPVSQLATEPQEVANQHWSTGQSAAIFANLAKACEKQWLMEEKALFEELSLYFSERSAVSANIEPDELSASLRNDLESLYPRAFAAAEQESDRGALRALTWSEKVSKISANLLDRYQKQGPSFVENTGLYVCDICGFIYLGDKLPEICPVCKVPNFKITAIAR